jgi:signal transduction histidine kinase
LVYYRYRLKKKANRDLEVKIAEALKRQKEQQQIIVHQASLTSLGELASGIAHEIKQPLQNISLATESLEDEYSAEVPDKKYIGETVRDIFEGIKRIKFIITEISNFSRGQQEQLCEPFSVNTRIQNAFSLARTKFSNRRIDVMFDLDENIPDIEGNPYKFEQVIVNFFNNAKDALEEKSAKTDQDFQKMMQVISRFSDNEIVVEVKDNGAGIPENIKTNIFLPFFTTKSLGKGSGLGLSISLGIIKEMGGFIELESKEMEGTTMRVKIPVKSI